jgi:hypothetical protein
MQEGIVAQRAASIERGTTEERTMAYKIGECLDALRRPLAFAEERAANHPAKTRKLGDLNMTKIVRILIAGALAATLAGCSAAGSPIAPCSIKSPDYIDMYRCANWL